MGIDESRGDPQPFGVDMDTGRGYRAVGCDGFNALSTKDDRDVGYAALVEEGRSTCDGCASGLSVGPEGQEREQ
jgi:hypothetical protein